MDTIDIGKLKDAVLEAGVRDGELCHAAHETQVTDHSSVKEGGPNPNSVMIAECIRKLLECLVGISVVLKTNLTACISAKMRLNHRKYPVELCKVSHDENASLEINFPFSYQSAWTGCYYEIHNIFTHHRYHERKPLFFLLR